MNTLKCEVTGLKITQKPEWTDLKITDKYSITFQFIGKRILHSIPRGNSSHIDIEKLYTLRNRVVADFVTDNNKIVEIKNSKYIYGRPPFSIQKLKNKYLEKDAALYISFIPYNINKVTGALIQTGLKFITLPYYMEVAGDYSSAVKKALDYIEYYDFASHLAVDKMIEKEAWKYRDKNCSAELKVIPGKILYLKHMGIITFECLKKFMTFTKKVYNAYFNKSQKYFLIIDHPEIAKQVRTSHRKLILYLQKLYKIIPPPARIYILYPESANNNIKRSAHRPLGVQILFFKELKNALAHIRTSLLCPGTTSTKKRKQRRKKILVEEEEVSKLVDLIAAISWGTGKVSFAKLKKRYAPFNKVYDALEQVNSNINNLITEQKKAKNTILQAKEDLEIVNNELKVEIIRANEITIKAESSNRAKGDFLAGISHEIRTPMSGVIGMAQLLLNTPLTERQEEYAKTIRKSAESLLIIINDILDFSKIEARKIQLEFIDFDLSIIFSDIYKIMNLKAREKGIEFSYNIDKIIPTRLKGDPGRIKQVLINLIGNAIKFTTVGKVVVNVSRVKIPDPGKLELRFDVTDTGIGIREEEKNKLFEMFEQADGSITRRFGGTGLGLTISKKLTETMGGRIGVITDGGKGTTFWFTVVLEQQESVKDVPVALQGEKLYENRGSGSLRFMIVNDTENDTAVFKKIISSQNWEWHIAPTPDNVCDVLSRDPYDFIIIGDCPTNEDGELLRKKIKNSPALRNIPVIMYTSSNKHGDNTGVEHTGFAAHLVPPVDEAVFMNCINRILHSPQSGIITQFNAQAEMKKRIKILVVDDNIVNRKVANGILKNTGYNPDVVSSGKEALDRLSQKKYDIIFMDVQMPEMDGFATTSLVKQMENGNEKIPIVAMTSHAMKGDREKCMEKGMDDYVSKPYGPEDLDRIIKKWIHLTEALLQ